MAEKIANPVFSSVTAVEILIYLSKVHLQYTMRADSAD